MWNQRFKSLRALCSARLALTGLGFVASFLPVAAKAQPLVKAAENADRPNVLLILVDDLKPAIGAFGDENALTPNLDQLTNSGMRFDMAYANQAVCVATRYNLMLGSRSTSTGLYDFGIQLRNVLPNATTMPQYFKQHGYHAESMGKVFHIGHGNHNDEQSWTVPHHKDLVIEYVLPESTEGGKRTREEALFGNDPGGWGAANRLPRGAAWEAPVGVPDDAYADGRTAEYAIQRLQELEEGQKQGNQSPFFLAVGFARPHLPFCVPQRYWDLYDANKLPLPPTSRAPVGAPGYAVKRGGELENYSPIKQIPSDEQPIETVRKLIHGYYASTSYVDAQIGKVMDALNASGLADNTIVVLWGDHGYHLGDSGMWTKHTNYEQATHIPLVIRAPGVTKTNEHTNQPASTVDVFPTLAALCGLPNPADENLQQPIDGESLVPVLQDPDARVRPYVYHCYPRGGKLGRAVRTEQYRLVEWRPMPNQNGQPAEPVEYELYDYSHRNYERVNLAPQHPEIVAELKQYLDEQPTPKRRG